MSKSNNGASAVHGFDERLEALKDSVRGMADFGRDTIGDLKDRAIDAKDSAFDGASSIVDRAAKLIKQHPFAAVGIAFGIGYIAMRLLRT
jgi:ElaB/YqjD/DUF883 family membrane-anchored ribosome-binding protein